MQLNPNDNAREARPTLWIFSGPTIGFVPLAVLASICSFMILSRTGFEWRAAILISALPCLGLAALAYFFLNGQPPNYLFDLLALASWRLRCWLYFAGWLDNPPLFRVKVRAPRHPSEFNP
jgi:hypothetical protein